QPQHFGKRGEEHGADDDPAQAAHAAEEDDDQEIDGERDGHLFGAHHREVVDVERADAAGERGGDREGEQPVLERVDGGGAGQRLVVAHGVERAAEAERRQAVVEHHDAEERAERQPVVSRQRGDGQRAELRLGNTGDAQRPARDLYPVVGDDGGDKGQPESADGEGVLGQAEEWHADQRGHQRGGDGRGRDVRHERPALRGGEDPGGGSADTGESRGRQRQAADVADHEVVGERERGEERGEDQDVQDIALLARYHGRDDPRRRRDDEAEREPAG